LKLHIRLFKLENFLEFEVVHVNGIVDIMWNDCICQEPPPSQHLWFCIFTYFIWNLNLFLRNDADILYEGAPGVLNTSGKNISG
jgi:hypothetical protein